MKKLFLLLFLVPFFGLAQFNPIFFVSGKVDNEFISTWKTDNISTGSSANNQVKLPLYSLGTYNFTVDWGDGNSDVITVYNQAEVTHTYSAIGTYVIKIKGICNGWYFNGTFDRLKFLSVSNWGKLEIVNNNAFAGCANLNLSSVSGKLILSNSQAALGLFANCTALTTVNGLIDWDFSGCTTFLNTWLNDTNFNQDISAINVSNSTDFGLTLRNCSAFNQNIGLWNVGNGTTFTNFMQGKTAANFSTSNLDAIYNGWINNRLKPTITTTFGTAKYTAAATEGRALLTRANITKTITNAVNNGSGLIRVTVGGHGLTTNNKAFVHSVTGTAEANGLWIVTVIDADTIDLQSSTFTNTYISGGTLIAGYGWTITDGGI